MHLITISDLKTHKKGVTNLIIDDRLSLSSSKFLNAEIDYKVGKPYGLDADSYKDYLFKKKLTDKLFPIVVKNLNLHHKTRYDDRFWKIIIGFWFDKYLNVIINRVGVIEKCFLDFQISSTSRFKLDKNVLIKDDLTSFKNACDEELWNHFIYHKIIEILNFDIDEEIINEKLEIVKIPLKQTKKKIIKDFIYQIFFNVLNLFSRRTDGLIINSYLSKFYEAKLTLALGQIPLFHRTKNFKTSKKEDFLLRNSLSEKLDEHNNESCNVENIARKLLFQVIPICYLEGFSEMVLEVNKLPWPAEPRFIFTSNSFHSDELFKLWVAIKTHQGAKYFVGQHGNNYGTSKFLNPSIEEDTSDVFLTWGWSMNAKEIPAFAFNLLGKNYKFDPDGGLLLVQDMMYQKDTTWDGASHFSRYIENLFLLVKGLNSKTKNDLTVRIHKYSSGFDFCENRWNKFDNSVKIDKGVQSILKKYNESRLVIHSYDSTGFLETLSQNIPTLVLLNYGSYGSIGLDHLRESAIPHYKLLIDAGIIHLSAESLSDKVNEIYDNVDIWWNQELIQSARRAFCDQYVQMPKSPIKDLKNLIKYKKLI